MENDLLSKIRDDRDHGSTELAMLGLEGIRLFASSFPAENGLAKLQRDVNDLVAATQQCRPSMAALNHLMSRLLKSLSAI